MKIKDVNKLNEIAKTIRRDTIEAIYSAKSGHPGGSLSCIDILTVLYFNQMNIDPGKPRDNGRDRFILSKGHASAALYSTLANRGYFSKEKLKTFRHLGSELQGHPDMNKIPGVDMTTGSLGQGLSVSNGIALSSKLRKAGIRVYCLLGDGELEEGQVWEAAMTSAQYKLDNLCVIVDNNNLQIDGKIEDVKSSYPITSKFESFGFYVVEVDGNNIEELMSAFQTAKMVKNMPTAIIAKTVKGKGVTFMEDKAEWHGKVINEEQYNQALMELE